MSEEYTDAELKNLRKGLTFDGYEQQPTKHDPHCDCGICAYCNGQEDVQGNPSTLARPSDNGLAYCENIQRRDSSSQGGGMTTKTKITQQPPTEPRAGELDAMSKGLVCRYCGTDCNKDTCTHDRDGVLKRPKAGTLEAAEAYIDSLDRQADAPTTPRVPTATPEHSPLPWASYYKLASPRKPVEIIDDNGALVAGIYATDDDEQDANLHLILNAVNQHDRLVAALRELLEIVEDEGHASNYVPQVAAAREALANEQKEGE